MTPTEALAVARVAMEKVSNTLTTGHVQPPWNIADETLRAIANVDAEPVAPAITDDPDTWPPVDVPFLIWSIAFNRWSWHFLEKPLLLRPADDYSHWRPAPPDPTRKEANSGT